MTYRRPFSRRLIRGERGAVATVFAVLLAGGVIMGMLAITVDVGTVWAERRQIQNGADAAALALAQDCAKGDSACSPGAQNALQDLAGDNAVDDRTDVTELCGTGEAPDTLATCPTPQTQYADLPQCLPLPSGFSGPYVEVRTRTRETDGSTILPKYFSQLLLGGGADVTVNACSRAGWGPLGQTKPTMPLVVGLCNWEAATNGGTQFIKSPPYSPAPFTGSAVPSLPTTDDPPTTVAPNDFVYPIFGHVNGSETGVHYEKFGCWADLSSPPPSGSYTPGGFGWVKTCADLGAAAPPECAGADPCTAVFTAIDTVDANTGASLPGACKDVLKTYVGKEVDIPIITAVTGNGGNAVYTVEGIASYFLAGYAENPSADPKSFHAYQDDVDAYKSMTCFEYKSSCVWGWFTAPLRPVGSMAPGGTDPRGPVVVAPAG